MRKLTRFAAAAVWILAGFGCTVEQAALNSLTPTADQATLAATPAGVELTETAAPTTAPTETSAPTPEQVSGQVQAAVMAQGVFLRNGPGTLFQPRKLLDQNTPLTLLGRARGADWLLVEAGGDEGWIAEKFVLIDDPALLGVLPVNNPSDVITIRGQVVDTFGGPVEGITFAVVQGFGDAALRTDATTGKDGFFYAYLPADATGAWRVALTGADCKSPVVDEECTLKGTFVPTWMDIELPVSGLITFQYVSQ